MRLVKKGLTAVVQRACGGSVARLTADISIIMKVCGKNPGNLDA